MKIKAVKPIPVWDSLKGFDEDIWHKLNAGKSVEVDKIPEKALDYVKQLKKKGEK